MRYREIINRLAGKRQELGMSDTYIAQKAKLSQPTVNRILSGRHASARLDQIIAIAEVLGMNCQILDAKDAENMRHERARHLARKLAETTQATMALEGQGLKPKSVKDMTGREISKLLAGPNKKLWSDK
jgi:transcriptional regulator with XRE-family HTH domain